MPEQKPVMPLKACGYPIASLIRVAKAESFPRDNLDLGARVCLNSGGPASLVVEVKGNARVIAWRDDAGASHEATFDRMCLRLLPRQP